MTNLTTLKEWRDQVPSAAVLEGWSNKLKKDHRTRTVKQILLEAAKSTEDGDAIRAQVIMQMASIEDDGRTYETGGKEWMTQVVENGPDAGWLPQVRPDHHGGQAQDR